MLQRFYSMAALTLTALLAACGPSGDGTGPGTASSDEARALDEAAEMLEQRDQPEEALPTSPSEEAPTPPEDPKSQDE